MTPHQLRLLSLLEAHVAADAGEQAHLDHQLDFARREPACFDRTTLPGHFTGSAFILDPARGLVLLHHHQKLDRWLQMGGHDEGERDVLATALREAREESGLGGLQLPTERNPVIDVDVHAIPARKTEAGHLHLDVRVVVRADAERDLPQMDPNESRALAWVPLAELPSRMGNEPGAFRVQRKLMTWCVGNPGV